MSLNTQSGAYSYMTFLLAKYTMNGTLIGYELLNDELQTVRSTYCFLLSPIQPMVP